MTADGLPVTYNDVIEADTKKLISRRDTRYNDFQFLISKLGMGDYCSVHPEFLWRAVLDYFKDIENLKKRHNYTFTHPEKIYAYELYWYLRNNVIQVTDPLKQMNDKQLEEYPERLFVNDYILTFWAMKSLCIELKSKIRSAIQADDFVEHFVERFENHKSVAEFHQKLCYTIRRRAYTKELLLLVFEAFMSGVELVCVDNEDEDECQNTEK